MDSEAELFSGDMSMQGWQKKAGNTSISHDGGKYWEFPGNTGIYLEIP